MSDMYIPYGIKKHIQLMYPNLYHEPLTFVCSQCGHEAKLATFLDYRMEPQYYYIVVSCATCHFASGWSYFYDAGISSRFEYRGDQIFWRGQKDNV